MAGFYISYVQQLYPHERGTNEVEMLSIRRVHTACRLVSFTASAGRQRIRESLADPLPALMHGQPQNGRPCACELTTGDAYSGRYN